MLKSLLKRWFPCVFAALTLMAGGAGPSHAQAALLVEEPYGVFGALNPTGHTAVYFARICAASPVALRRCREGELGAVISRYQGIDGYDWIAMPLIPYLYSVNDAALAPERADRATVQRLRSRYREAHLLSLGENLPPGSFFNGGWEQLIGVSYERRIYAFRFSTSEAQDDALIAQLNGAPNRAHFSLLYSNCADFARTLLEHYFPGAFHRNLFPDAGMTTPKQIAFKLTRLSRKHPEMHLSVFEIAQIPGYRRKSRSNKDVSEALATTAYAVPIFLANPYLAGGLAVDYMARGRYRIVPRDHIHLTALSIDALSRPLLTQPGAGDQNAASAARQVSSAATATPVLDPMQAVAQSGLQEIGSAHE
jgi:hypothetical protein